MVPHQQMVIVSLQRLEWCKEPVFWFSRSIFDILPPLTRLKLSIASIFLLQYRWDSKVFCGRIGHLNSLMYVSHLPDSCLPTETAAPHGFKPILVTWFCLQSQNNGHFLLKFWHLIVPRTSSEHHRFEGKPGLRWRTSGRHFFYYATDALTFSKQWPLFPGNTTGNTRFFKVEATKSPVAQFCVKLIAKIAKIAKNCIFSFLCQKNMNPKRWKQIEYL